MTPGEIWLQGGNMTPAEPGRGPMESQTNFNNKIPQHFNFKIHMSIIFIYTLIFHLF